MLRQFHFDGPFLKQGTGGPAVWVDLLNPEKTEIEEANRTFALDLPTLDQMREIETSSRLYEDRGVFYMTITYVADALGDNPETTPLTFALKNDVLATVRYKEMRIVTHFIEKATSRGPSGSPNAAGLMIGLLENIVDLAADALEKNHMDIENENRAVFEGARANQDYRQSLRRIAMIDELNSKMRESLVSLSRLHSFMHHAFKALKATEDCESKLRTLATDIQSLLDHAAFVSGKAAFLLDATLGMINIEQNAIIKIFSVAAVIFLPPTLVASIYGMNFKYMPELAWLGGYPFALALMVVSALLPYVYFKRRGWL